MQTHTRIMQTTKHGALAYFIYLTHCVEAFNKEQTICTSVIDEHDIINVSAQVENVPGPAVTVALQQQH